MFIKKLICVVVSLVMVLGIIAGCTNSSTTKEQKQIELYVTHAWGGSDPKAPIYEAIFKRYQEKYPNVKLKVEALPGEGYNDKVNTWIASKQIPDVMHTDMFPYTQKMVDANLALELTPYLNKDSEWKNSFVPGIFDNGCTFDGKIYFMPNEYFSMPLYVNRELLKEYNLSTPQTWDELINAMKTIKAAGKHIPVTMWGIGGDNTGVWLVAMMASSGAYNEWADAIEGKAKFNNPKIIENLERLVSFTELAQDGVNATEWPASMTHFNTSKAAFYLNGTWAIGQLAEGPEGEAFMNKLDLVPIPYIDKSMKGYMNLGVVMSWAASASMDEEKKMPAVNVLKEITSPQAGKEYIEISKGLNGTIVKDYDKSKIGRLADVMNLMKDMPSSGRYLFAWPTVVNVDVTSLYFDLIQQLVDKKITAQEMVNELDKAAENK